VTDESWATARLVRLARPLLSDFPRPRLLEPLIRAGLLIDLALRERIVSQPERVEIDIRPTGFKPADDLSRSVVGKPDRPLAWWLLKGQTGFRAVAAYLVATGVWRRSPRLGRTYVDQDPESLKIDLACVKAVLDTGGIGSDPETVAVGCLLQLLPASGADSGPAALQLAEHCGKATWLAQELVSELVTQRARWDGASPQLANLRDLLTSPFNPI
jgi:hypothetical protein